MGCMNMPRRITFLPLYCLVVATCSSALRDTIRAGDRRMPINTIAPGMASGLGQTNSAENGRKCALARTSAIFDILPPRAALGQPILPPRGAGARRLVACQIGGADL